MFQEPAQDLFMQEHHVHASQSQLRIHKKPWLTYLIIVFCMIADVQASRGISESIAETGSTMWVLVFSSLVIVLAAVITCVRCNLCKKENQVPTGNELQDCTSVNVSSGGTEPGGQETDQGRHSGDVTVFRPELQPLLHEQQLPQNDSKCDQQKRKSDCDPVPISRSGDKRPRVDSSDSCPHPAARAPPAQEPTPPTQEPGIASSGSDRLVIDTEAEEEEMREPPGQPDISYVESGEEEKEKEPQCIIIIDSEEEEDEGEQEEEKPSPQLGPTLSQAMEEEDQQPLAPTSLHPTSPTLPQAIEEEEQQPPLAPTTPHPANTGLQPSGSVSVAIQEPSLESQQGASAVPISTGDSEVPGTSGVELQPLLHEQRLPQNDSNCDQEKRKSDCDPVPISRSGDKSLRVDSSDSCPHAGFNLGYNVQAETKGIWMWCVPHPRRLDHTLVLLDTEGLGDVEKGDSKNDIRIFSLAVLLSSALVYNSKGTIDQDALNKLRFVGELAELIKVKSKDNEDEEAEFSEHFPIFIWAVRDFTLGLVIDGQVVTEDEYLENALKLKTPEKTMKNMEYNKPRNCLRMYFSSRKCFAFDHPSADKEVLQKMEQVPESELKPEFVDQSKKFCDYVFRNAEVKRVTGIPLVTGDRLAKLAKTYTEAISSSNVACMEEVVLSLSETENKAAVQDAIQYYETKMNESVVFPTDTLEQFLHLSRQCENEALEIFMKKSFKDKDHKFQKQFVELVLQKKEDFCRMNETKSRELCETLIKKLSAEFEDALAAGKYSVPGGHKQFMQDLEAIQEKYKTESGKGVQADIVLKDYLMSKKSIETNILKSDEALTENEKKLEEEKARQKKEDLERRARQLEDAQGKQKIDDQVTTMEENMKQLQEKLSEERRLMKHQVERVMEEKNREMESYRSQGSQQANMYQAQIEDLKEKKEELNDPGWYTPIFNGFTQVLSAVAPTVIGIILKKKFLSL